LIGDLLMGIDLELPELSDEARQALAQVLPPFSTIANPLDAWGTGNFEETYPVCMEIVAQEKTVHLLAVSRDSPPGIAEREAWQSRVIVDAAARVARAYNKPVVIFSNLSTGFDQAVRARADAAGLPLLQGTRESLRAIEALVKYAELQRQPRTEQPRSPLSQTAQAQLKADLAAAPPSLTEYRSKRLLAEYDVSVTREQLARSADEAVRLAEEIGGPVVLKIQSPDVLHKTEAGGVQLNLIGDEAVRQGYEQIIRNIQAYNPSALIEGVLVQEMLPASAVEVIIGSSCDPDFGPVVVFGLGGIMVELFQDSALRLAPVTEAEAKQMIAETRGAQLLYGFRGRHPADVAALTRAIVRVSHLAYDLRDVVAAVDVNPLMVLPAGQGVRAADALIVKREVPVFKERQLCE
jgi:acyl-CoA synthetase (NDP forming)